jgi:hypothetical protein
MGLAQCRVVGWEQQGDPVAGRRRARAPTSVDQITGLIRLAPLLSARVGTDEAEGDDDDDDDDTTTMMVMTTTMTAHH